MKDNWLPVAIIIFIIICIIVSLITGIARCNAIIDSDLPTWAKWELLTK